LKTGCDRVGYRTEENHTERARSQQESQAIQRDKFRERHTERERERERERKAIRRYRPYLPKLDDL